MKLEVYNITVEQMKQLISQQNSVTVSDIEMRTIASVAHFSKPLLAGIYNGTLLAIFGFVPQTVLSDRAHLWVWNTPEVNQHKTIFARTSKAVIDNMLNEYAEIVGYCFTPQAKMWVGWLGGDFETPMGNAHPFTIRRH